MSEAAYYRIGDTIEETAAAAVTAGQVEQKGGRAAVAVEDYAIGDVAVYQVRGNVKTTLDGLGKAANAGDPVWWDSSGDVATVVPTDPISNSGDFYMGTLAADVAAAATSAEVCLNEECSYFFPGKVYNNKIADYTVDAEDSGKVLTQAITGKVFTLPATVAGLEVIIQTIAADGVGITMSPNASDKIMGPDVAGTDDKDQILTAATAIRGDYLHLRGDGDAGWWIVAKRGIWAEEG